MNKQPKRTPMKSASKGLSAVHVLGVLFALGIAAILLFVDSDEEVREREAKVAQVARLADLTRLVTKFYAGEVSAGTFGKWTVVSVKSSADNPYSDKINAVTVRVVVNDRVADDILSRSTEGRARAAANGCPPRSNYIYSLMTNNDNLALEVENRGSVFISVPCDRWAM